MDSGSDDGTEDEYREALDAAHRHALGVAGHRVRDRPIRPELDADGILARLEPRLPEAGISPAAVIDELAEAAGPGLIAMGSPRFYGLVIGGTYPAAMAADWLRLGVGPEHRAHVSSRRRRPRSKRSRRAGCSSFWACPRAAGSDS